MATTVEFLQHVHIDGVDYVPGQTATLSDELARVLIDNYGAILVGSDSNPGPTDPYPQYERDEDLDADVADLVADVSSASRVAILTLLLEAGGGTGGGTGGGDTGGGSTTPVSMPGYYFPETYGAVGDGVADDTAAVQQAINNASAAGGGVVQLTKKYGWKGDLLQKNAVTVTGVGAVSFANANNGLIALDGTARYRYGDQAGNPYPGPLQNLQIKGNNVGGASQLVRVEAVEGTMRDVFVTNGVADGVVIAAAQNCSIDHCSFGGFPNGSAIRFRDDDERTPAQGAGGNKITNSYFHTANKLVYVDISSNTRVYAHDNIFIGCLFEQYQDNVHSLVHLADGETLFKACVFTGSAGLLTSTAGAVVLLENQIRPTIPTAGTFETCYFGGGAVGVPHLIRTNSYGAANLLRIYGRTQVANANQGYFLCDDRGGGGLGTIGGVFGPVDGLTSTFLLATGINGGSAAAFANDLVMPSRYIMDTGLGNPIQVRRKGDAINRWQVTRDGQQQWFNGSSSVPIGAVVPGTTGLGIQGQTLVQWAASPTSSRPAANLVLVGTPIWDSTLHKPIWSDGVSVWYDAAGNPV